MTAALPSLGAAVRGREPSPAAAFGRFLASPPFLLAAVAVLVYALPGATGWLELDRAGLAAGEFWRLLTGHWTHWSQGHLAWDAVAFVALGSQCHDVSRRLFWNGMLWAALAISLLVLTCQPEIQIYRGLSGIDAAFFAALTVDTLRTSRKVGRPVPILGVVLAAGLFAAKLAYEFSTQAAFFVDLGPGVIPLPLAHLVGAVAGGLAAWRLR